MAVKNFRIGNDLVVLWAICNRDGSPYNLANKQVRLFVMNERGRKEVVPVLTTLPDGSINNVIRWDFYGMEQRVMGLYTLSVEIFTDEDKKSIKKDYCEAFCLVGSSSLEDEDLADNISDGGELILSSSLDVIQLTIPRIEIGVNGNWIIDGIDSGVSALGGGPGLVNKIYDVFGFGKEYDPTSVIDTFNAYAINSLYGSIKDAEKDIQDAEKDIQDVWGSISTLEEDVEYLKTFGGGGSGGGSISQEQLAAIMEAIGKKADKATTLEGYGIANAYNKTYIDSILNKYVLLSASHQTIKGDITIEGNLVVKGDMASQGEGNPSLVGASGVIVGATEYRDLNGDGLIDLTSLMALYTPLSSHNSLASRVSTLEGKSTSVSVSQTLTSGKEIGSITIDGVAKSLYAPSTYDWSEIANQPSITVAYGYSASNFEELKWSGRDLLLTPYRYLIADNATGSLFMTWSIGKLESEFAKYLPLSGGTIKSQAIDAFTINRNGGGAVSSIAYKYSDSLLYGYLGFDAVNNPIWMDSAYNRFPLIHSGNVGDYAIKVNPSNINLASDTNVAGYGQTADGWPVAGPALLLSNIDGRYAMMLSGRKGVLRFNTRENGTLSDWKTIAFTDSNVASAYKLLTKDNKYMVYLSDAGNLLVGDNIATGETHIIGNRVNLRYGTSATYGLILNSSGNVTIGASDLAGTSAKLYVNGGIRFAPRTIWGKSFDGTSDITGSVIIQNNSGIYIKDTAGSQKQTLLLTPANNLMIGQDTAIAGYNTYLYGNNLYFKYGNNIGVAMTINSSGNVTIGSSDLAGTTAKLYVGGRIRAQYINLENGNEINCFLDNGDSAPLCLNWDSSGNILLGIGGGNVGIGTASPSAKLHVVGDAIVTGDLASGSDIRFKDIISNTSIDIKDIANAPLFTFKWNDREDNNTHLGTSAQYWESISPELVTGEDFKTLNYASLGVAMGISLAKKVINHEERIKVLEERINELETENRRLMYGS